MNICAIILSAGKSKRFKSSKPKFLHEISGKELIQYNLDALNKIKQVKNIILESAFISTGERCSCARKLILPNNKYGKKILDSIKKDLDDPSTTNHFLGPLISNEARLKVISQQKKLKKIGARIIKESKVPKGKGFFITPGLIDSTNLKERFDEEIFLSLIHISEPTRPERIGYGVLWV